MLRVTYSVYRLSSSIFYLLRRRFTPAGWMALLGLFVTGFIGLDLDQSVASQTFAILFCMLVISMLSAIFFRGRFQLERRLPRYGSVGRSFTYVVLVRNRKSKAWPELELLEDLADPRPTWEQFLAQQPSLTSRSFRLTQRPAPSMNFRRAIVRPASVPPLPPGGEAEAHAEILPLKRGPLRFAGATVAQRDPFGLFRAFSRAALPQTVLILPKRYMVPALALPGIQKYQQGGVAFATSVGESEEFVSVRDYRPGDPLRHVHWRSSARTGRLVVKEFEDEFFMRYALVLDTFAAPGQSEAFEEAVSVAASFACTVDTQESLLDLMFVGTQAVCFTTGRGVAQAEQALEILAAIQPCRAKPFSTLQALVLQHARVVSGCVCILLDWDESRRELVQKLRAHGLPLQVLVITDKAGASRLAGLAPEEGAGLFHVLQAGHIEEGLASLNQSSRYLD